MNFFIDSLYITAILIFSGSFISIAYPEPVSTVSQTTSALPSVQVTPLHDEVEIEFLPEATVAIVDAEISVEYISETNPRNVVCGEYTCTFTPQ